MRSDLKNRLGRLEAKRSAPTRTRFVVVANLADPLPEGSGARPGERVVVVATGIRREAPAAGLGGQERRA